MRKYHYVVVGTIEKGVVVNGSWGELQKSEVQGLQLGFVKWLRVPYDDSPLRSGTTNHTHNREAATAPRRLDFCYSFHYTYIVWNSTAQILKFFSPRPSMDPGQWR